MTGARGTGGGTAGEGLSVLVLGTGDAFSAERYSSCLALRCGASWLLVDCPHPIRKILREASRPLSLDLDVDAFEAVVLTHLHADHASGVEGFGYFSHFVCGRRARLACHPGVAAGLWEGHLRSGMGALMEPGGVPEEKGLEDWFELVALDTERPVRIGPFEIECRPTLHHIPTTALRIRAGGSSLGYSADTAFDPELIEWLGEADLVIHETNFGAHTPYEDLAGLPEALRRRMRLIHYPDGFDLEGAAIAPLRDGDWLDVQPNNAG